MADELPLINKIAQTSSHKIRENVIGVSYGNGYEQRTVVGENQQADSWSLNYLVLDEVEREVLLSFWRDKGNHDSFTWTAFGDLFEKTWLISGNYSETALSGELFKVAFSIIQVFEL